MSFRHAAFLSYSRHDDEWAGVLQQNLETSLESLGHEPSTVFRDRTDLAPGRSWVTGLQQGLDEAPRVILVTTPESMASHRVADEWQALVANYPDWSNGRVLIARAVDCPLPPFLKAVQWIDFTDHDEAKYREALRDLLGGILGHTDRRKLPALPGEGVTIPAAPTRPIPADLRGKVVDWLAQRLGSKVLRMAITQALGVPAQSLDAHPSWECAASALIVDYAGGDEPVKGLQRLLRALVTALDEDLPDEVAELEPLQQELEKLEAERGPVGLERKWLERVVADHGRLERYFQKDADLDLLARVYVELDLAAETEGRAVVGAPAESGTEAAKAALHQPQEIRDLLALEPGSAAGVTGRWVVLGDPGAGKTTMLRHLAASLAREALEAGEAPPWIPVYESLPIWLRERERLPDRLERRLDGVDASARGFATLVEERGREGRLLLLLDGLDEVPRERRDEAEKWLRDLVVHWPDARMVVTSRPIGYRPPGTGFTEVRLLPLDRERRRALLARWLGRRRKEVDEAGADRALGVLEGDRSLWELSGNPLYLTLMAMLLEEEITPDRNRTRLYDQIFDLLLKGKHRPEPVPMDAEEATRGVLRHLAYGMTDDNRDAEPKSALEARFLSPDLDPLRETLYRIPRWHGVPTRFFNDLAERTGILGAHDGEDADWRYRHRTFREALAAERLEEVMGEGGTEAVLARAGEITEDEDASRWAEPYALLTGRVAEPDGLVRELVEANRPLGLRALASARTLKPETVVEVLGLTGNNEERAKVYQELPRLVGDGRAVLELVDRLRREKRNGNDLFWLDWVAREVGREDPERAGEVEALLGRFFDHIDPPPAEMFGDGAEVETGRDGRVPLWCEIQAGDFLMGSPEDEEGRFDREGPRHRVELVSGFRLAAVPVTRAQYALFDPEHQSHGFGGVDEDDLAHHPVNQVPWWSAVSFCRWLSQALPGVRLPTEAEWEYACRAGTETPYWNGEGEAALEEVGWYDENSGKRTHRVGELRPNPWGLYDVHGNVDEWTLSPWTDNYSDRRDDETEDPGSLDAEALIGNDPGGGRRVIRGGSFADDARDARSAFRYRWHPGNVLWVLGFRVALPPAPSDPRS